MAFEPENLGLTSTGLPLLRDLIHEHTGLFYDNGRYDSLTDRLAPLILERGFRSFLDFYYLLKYDDRNAPTEWRRVLNALSVPETYFWREVEQMHGFSQHVLPELVRAFPGQPLRIWSVPCATGEEPLTIAMVLNEDGWFSRAPIEIHASDASSVAIDKARAGRYRERSFRTLSPELREKYFIQHGTEAEPVPSLRDRVTSWSVVNLKARDEIAAPAASAPVIFCRNAFIYFSPQSVKAVVEAFAAAMPSPGYLFVGASESLLNVTDRFMLEDVNRAFVYVKR
ncbi:MAG TPA: protein-glutamate O-methyltransferase CheR [Vicinamibacterales bacterium]|jgi:chemotaxis protein methyltransferase CheR